jgi:uncharacterized membrane protein YoaK (UPF0700 family)
MERHPPARKLGLVVGLAGVAGFVDAIGYIVLSGLFTAHMSGNSARLGVHLGRGDLSPAIPLIVAVGIFIVGCAAGATIVELARRRGLAARDAPALAIQALLLAAFTLYGAAQVGAGSAPSRSGPFYVLAALAILAIGLQAATITQVAGATIRTAYISGMLTRLGQSLAGHLLRERDVSAAYTGLLAMIVLIYFCGAAAGSLLQRAIGAWAMAVPVALLAAAAAEDVRRPFERED